MNEPRNLGTAVRYFWRASRLRCPVCGRSKIFPDASRLRRLSDWFAPLDGCPRCGYAYEREPGYFLLAIWAVNYGCASMLGLALYAAFELLFDWSLGRMLVWTLLPVFVFNILFARHSKAYFLAIDHFFDPHERGDDDGSGNEPTASPPGGRGPSRERPLPAEPCETVGGMR